MGTEPDNAPGHPGAERVFLAEVARQPDQPDAGILRPLGLEALKGVIGAAIVDT